jgi:5-formyltetrahydrofolate cyclo-ligase
MLSRRNVLAESQIARLSKDAQAHVLKSEIFSKARSIGAYCAFGSEIRTNEIIDNAISGGKTVSLPTVEGKNIRFYEYTNRKYLVRGRFGIMEPLPYGETTDMDLLIVPGVAFDKTGSRLGYGKAYYDRYLTNSQAYSIGLAYSFQLTDSIPQHPHDRKVNAVATEKGIIFFRA